MEIKKYLAECVGTFVLVLVACGVAAITGGDIVPTALAFGFVIIAMAYSIGNVSGCHLNPAVSFAMFVTQKMNFKDLKVYYEVQREILKILKQKNPQEYDKYIQKENESAKTNLVIDFPSRQIKNTR